MYDDAFENAEEALKIQPDNRKSLLRKATSLAFLSDYEQSFKLFTQLGDIDSLRIF
jgi:tetratricopeptide (TPR) repeat protein